MHNGSWQKLFLKNEIFQSAIELVGQKGFQGPLKSYFWFNDWLTFEEEAFLKKRFVRLIDVDIEVLKMDVFID